MVGVVTETRLDRDDAPRLTGPGIRQSMSGLHNWAGLLLGWVRILQRGNLWAVIIAHASVNVIMMSLAYAGELGIVPTG